MINRIFGRTFTHTSSGRTSLYCVYIFFFVRSKRRYLRFGFFLRLRYRRDSENQKSQRRTSETREFLQPVVRRDRPVAGDVFLHLRTLFLGVGVWSVGVSPSAVCFRSRETVPLHPLNNYHTKPPNETRNVNGVHYRDNTFDTSSGDAEDRCEPLLADFNFPRLLPFVQIELRLGGKRSN